LAAACGDGGARPAPLDAGIDTGVGSDATADRGPTSPWTVQALPADAERLNFWDLIDMDGAGADRYIVGAEAVLLQSIDSGQTWTNIGARTGFADRHPYAFPAFTAVSVPSIDAVWVLVMTAAGTPTTPAETSLLRSTDLGQTWLPVPTTGVRPTDVWAANRQRVLLLAPDGEIWRTADAGTTWTRVFADPTRLMTHVWGTRTSDVYVVGEAWGAGATGPDGGADADGDAGAGATAGFVLHSADGGETWRAVVTDVACTLYHVSGTADGSVVWASGACGSLAWTEDGGASWSTMGSRAMREPKYTLGGVWVSPTGTPCFGVEHRSTSEPGTSVCSRLVVRDDQFAPLSCAHLPTRQGTLARPTALWGTSDDDIWAYAGAGLLWHKQ
jgi:photosystem II stability/assembly factor-like uncharacterized protein